MNTFGRLVLLVGLLVSFLFFGALTSISSRCAAAPPAKKPIKVLQPKLLHSIGLKGCWNALQFNKDGTKITAVSLGGAISVIDARSGEASPRRLLDAGLGAGPSAGISNDASRVVLVTKGRFQVIDVETGNALLDQHVAELADAVDSSIHFSADGKFAAVKSTGRNQGFTRVIDLQTGQIVRSYARLMTNVEFSRGGQVAVLRESPPIESGPTAWKIVELNSGTTVGVISQSGILASSASGKCFVGLEATGQLLTTGTRDGRTVLTPVAKTWIGIWDNTGNLKMQWDTGELSATGSNLYSLSLELYRGVWMAADDRLVAQLFVAEGSDRGIHFWDATNGKIVGRLPIQLRQKPTRDFVSAVSMTGDGVRLAIAVNTYSQIKGGVGGEIVDGGARIDVFETKTVVDSLSPPKQVPKKLK